MCDDLQRSKPRLSEKSHFFRRLSLYGNLSVSVPKLSHRINVGGLNHSLFPWDARLARAPSTFARGATLRRSRRTRLYSGEGRGDIVRRGRAAAGRFPRLFVSSFFRLRIFCPPGSLPKRLLSLTSHELYII